VDERVGRVLLAAVIASLAAGCGEHSRRLRDGSWYGKVVTVDVRQRTVAFAPACRLSESRRWVAVPATTRAPVAVAMSPRAKLQIYFRPGGNAAAGHPERVDLRHFADVALHGHLPAFPPGWFMTIEDRAAASVREDTGIRSSGKAEQRRYACVWSRSTQRFVRR
jgi:hypothetical protein